MATKTRAQKARVAAARAAARGTQSAPDRAQSRYYTNSDAGLTDGTDAAAPESERDTPVSDRDSYGSVPQHLAPFDTPDGKVERPSGQRRQPTRAERAARAAAMPAVSDVRGERGWMAGRVEACREAVEAAETALRLSVRSARRAGASWDDIGDALGVTRQSASRRFGV